MQEDYIIRTIESVFKFIRKLLNIDLEENKKGFIQKTEMFLKNSFGFDSDMPEQEILSSVYKKISDQEELKNLHILLFRISYSYSFSEKEKGRKLYHIIKKVYHKNDKTASFYKTKRDLEIKNLLILNKRKYE